MIKLEEVLKLSEKEKESNKPNIEKENELFKQLQETLSKWTIAVNNNNNTEANRLKKEADNIKSEMDILASLNSAKETGIFSRLLKREGNLAKVAKDFETQQFAEFERLLSERDKALENYKKILEKLYDAAEQIRIPQHKAGKLISEMAAVKEHIESPINTDSLQFRFFSYDHHINPGIKLKQAWDRPIIRELEAQKEA